MDNICNNKNCKSTMLLELFENKIYELETNIRNLEIKNKNKEQENKEINQKYLEINNEYTLIKDKLFAINNEFQKTQALSNHFSKLISINELNIQSISLDNLVEKNNNNIKNFIKIKDSKECLNSNKLKSLKYNKDKDKIKNRNKNIVNYKSSICKNQFTSDNIIQNIISDNMIQHFNKQFFNINRKNTLLNLKENYCSIINSLPNLNNIFIVVKQTTNKNLNKMLEHIVLPNKNNIVDKFEINNDEIILLYDILIIISEVTQEYKDNNHSKSNYYSNGMSQFNNIDKYKTHIVNKNCITKEIKEKIIMTIILKIYLKQNNILVNQNTLIDFENITDIENAIISNTFNYILNQVCDYYLKYNCISNNKSKEDINNLNFFITNYVFQINNQLNNKDLIDTEDNSLSNEFLLSINNSINQLKTKFKTNIMKLIFDFKYCITYILENLLNNIEDSKLINYEYQDYELLNCCNKNKSIISNTSPKESAINCNNAIYKRLVESKLYNSFNVKFCFISIVNEKKLLTIDSNKNSIIFSNCNDSLSLYNMNNNYDSDSISNSNSNADISELNSFNLNNCYINNNVKFKSSSTYLFDIKNRDIFPFYLLSYIKKNIINELSIFDINPIYLPIILKILNLHNGSNLKYLVINHVFLRNKPDSYNYTMLLNDIFDLLSKFKNIVKLDLSFCDINNLILNILINSIYEYKNLSSLNLSNNNITSEGGILLSKMFVDNQIHLNENTLSKSLSKLYLSTNFINGIGLKMILENINLNCKFITLIDINNNNLELKDLVTITNFIKNSSSLEILNISYQKNLTCLSKETINSNNIVYNSNNNKLIINNDKAINEENEIINQFGLSIKLSNCLKVLICKDIGLNSENSPYLLQHLNESKLNEIYFDNNKISEIGGVLFSNVVKYNQHLKLFSLKGCFLNSNALMCISHAIDSNNNIEFINLEDNLFNERSVSNIENNLIKKNRNIKLKINCCK